jgi:hypothetical protein
LPRPYICHLISEAVRVALDSPGRERCSAASRDGVVASQATAEGVQIVQLRMAIKRSTPVAAKDLRKLVDPGRRGDPSPGSRNGHLPTWIYSSASSV